MPGPLAPWLIIHYDDRGRVTARRHYLGLEFVIGALISNAQAGEASCILKEKKHHQEAPPGGGASITSCKQKRTLSINPGCRGCPGEWPGTLYKGVSKALSLTNCSPKNTPSVGAKHPVEESRLRGRGGFHQSFASHVKNRNR